jgi:dTDP-4-dehydrorhamnose 3,5-epimerase
MRLLPTRLSGPLLIEPVVHGDERGFFHETFRVDALESLGLADVEFVQENHSRSARGVLRGLHFHVGPGVGKLVRCARGAILDVAVDLRRGSPTYGEWESFELNDANLHQAWIPPGFGHGFCTLSEVADVMYKQTTYFAPEIERAILWNDPDIGIQWPTDIEIVTSEKDAAAPLLHEIADELPFVFAEETRNLA